MKEKGLLARSQNGREMGLDGRFTGSGQFEVDHIETLKNGNYVCAIRTPIPGRRMCCQGPAGLEEIAVP